MRTRLSRSYRLAVSGLIIGCLALFMAGATSPTPAQAGPPGCGVPAQAALAEFFDSSVPERLVTDRTPGLAVSVVTGDELAFAEGYGVADLESGTPFDAERTLVRVGSVTKLFTWTAVMQQVEAGRLDLDTDVNRYLSAVTVPATYPEPVTLQSLMDHTAGFEERVIGTGARTADEVPPLGEYLAANQPARIRPPGEISAYSNYGAALAGHIVTEASGEPYDVYIQRHLLDPLRMTRSTATEPLPAPLSADLARSYATGDGAPVPVPFTFDVMAPDGAISATATDMAHFMSAHLNEGSFAGSSILGPATLARMHERSFAAHPRLGGYAHGFMDRTMGGHRVLMHDGSWEGFQTALILVPGCELGLFLSTNGTGGVATITELTRAFFERFLPDPLPGSGQPTDSGSPPAGPSGVTVASPRAGFYQPTRHNTSTIEKLLTLLGPARLGVAAEGTVHFRGKQWTPQGDDRYLATDGTDQLVFVEGRGGRRYVATDATTYQLVPRAASLTTNLWVLLAFVVAAVSAIAVPAAGLRRLTRRRTVRGATWRLARGLGAGAGGLGLAFLVLLAATLFGDTGEFLYGVPAGFRVLLVLPTVATAMTGVAAAGTVAGWHGSGASLAARIHQCVLLAGLGAMTWFLWNWNLIGWQY